MDKSIVKSIAGVLPLQRQLFNITFKERALFLNLELLLALNREGKIILSYPVSVQLALNTKEWKSFLPNRTISATFGPEAMLDSRFLDRISKDIEKIAPATPHPLNNLAVKREKTRKAAFDKFINEGLAALAPERLSEYGLSFTAKTSLWDFPHIAFVLENKDRWWIKIFILDSLTGCLITRDGKRPAKTYGGPHELRQAVMEEVIIYLEKETRPNFHSFA